MLFCIFQVCSSFIEIRHTISGFYSISGNISGFYLYLPNFGVFIGD